MKKRIAVAVMAWLLAAATGLGAQPAATPVGVDDVRFDVLQIGTHTYRNVTVTTRSKNYIYILHSAGMTNIKVSELPSELLQRLGYSQAEPKKSSTQANVTAAAQQALSKLGNAAQVTALADQLNHTLKSYAFTSRLPLPPVTASLLLGLVGGCLAVYLFYCYCCLLICRKAGETAGFLVWVPILQLVPMLRAARMPGWWFFMFFVPVINLVGHVSLCLKLAQARGKSLAVGFLMLVPVIGVLPFLYLAFSTGPSSEPQSIPKQHAELMTLETA